MSVIEIQHLTKDYGEHKGVFDVSIEIQQGEVYGYLGPNGAGKTTTIRHLMGFSKADQGTVRINGLNCWTQQKEIQKQLGYLPGEISFPNDMNGKRYLRLITQMRGMKDTSYMESLLTMFEINADMSLKRMSKGMKQKIGIVSAFMHDPSVILLDEPTSGLDPLMQHRFIQLVQEEKQKGKTILMSSHMFEEVEKICDRIGMIKEGSIIQDIDADSFRKSRKTGYRLGVKEEASMEQILAWYPMAKWHPDTQEVIVSVSDEDINVLIQRLSLLDLRYLKEEKHTLEEYFMQYYGGEKHE